MQDLTCRWELEKISVDDSIPIKIPTWCSLRLVAQLHHSTLPSFWYWALIGHYCCKLVLTQKKIVKPGISKNGSRVLWRNKKWCRLEDSTWYVQSIQPKFGGDFCFFLCTTSPQKRHHFQFQYWWFGLLCKGSLIHFP